MTTVAEAIEISIANDKTLASIESVIKKYQLGERDAKRLRGKLFMGGNTDPAGSLERGLVHDDGRLERFVANCRAANKSD